MTPALDVLDDIIGSLDPEDIPMEYILMAKVTDGMGHETILRGDDLADFLENPFSVSEIRILLDIKRIRSFITHTVNAIAKEVQKLAG